VRRLRLGDGRRSREADAKTVIHLNMSNCVAAATGIALEYLVIYANSYKIRKSARLVES